MRTQYAHFSEQWYRYVEVNGRIMKFSYIILHLSTCHVLACYYTISLSPRIYVQILTYRHNRRAHIHSCPTQECTSTLWNEHKWCLWNQYCRYCNHRECSLYDCRRYYSATQNVAYGQVPPAQMTAMLSHLIVINDDDRTACYYLLWW